MSFDVPNPSNPPYTTPHATVVVIDGYTGLPASFSGGGGDGGSSTSLTNAQLRAAPVPVNGPITDAQMRASAIPVSFTDTSLTDTQLRAAPVPIVGAATRTTVTTTIPASASVSNVIDLVNTSLVGFMAPTVASGWTTAALSIEVSTDNTTWAPAIISPDNTAVGSWPAIVAGNAYAVDPVSMLPFRYVRFRSGTAAAPVNQVAARAFVVITRPLA